MLVLAGQVAFYEATLDSERGAISYMNILIRQDVCCEELGLRKVPLKAGGKRPPSVRGRIILMRI